MSELLVIAQNVQVRQIDAAECKVIAAACSQLHSLTLVGARVSSPALFPRLANSCTQLRSLSLISLTWSSSEVAASLAAVGTGLPALQELAVTDMSIDLCAHDGLPARLTAVQVVGVSLPAACRSARVCALCP
jgi:hypothetical protein